MIPRGGPTRYAYNAGDRVATLTDPTGGVTTYDYTADDALAQVHRPSGTVSRYTLHSKSKCN